MRKHGDVAIDGFNPSAEGEDLDEGTEEVSESGYDIVLNQRLQETSYSKADFKLYLKNYTKNLMEKWKELEWSEEKINDAKAKLTNAAKKVLPIVGDAKFFMGKSTVFSLFVCFSPLILILYSILFYLFRRKHQPRRHHGHSRVPRWRRWQRNRHHELLQARPRGGEGLKMKPPSLTELRALHQLQLLSTPVYLQFIIIN